MKSAIDVEDGKARENCFFKISAYVRLVFVYVGLSNHHSRQEEGGSIPSGIDLWTIFSRFSSIQARATGKFDLVVRMRHLLRVTDSMHKNHICHRR